MTFGHEKSKQSAETSTQHQWTHLSGSEAGGSDHPKLEAPAAGLGKSVVQYNGIVRCYRFICDNVRKTEFKL